jgi:voltage-gated potassium channel
VNTEGDGARTRLKRWQHTTESALTTAAVVFLIAYSWEVIGELTGTRRSVAEWSMNIVWGLFAVDVAVQLTLAEDRLGWLRHHPLDVASVLLPVLRPLRLLRLVALVSVFQRTAGHSLRGKIAVYTAGSATLLVWVASLAVLDAERHASGATITTVPDAIWWAFATITTVGYGDLSPVTPTGRIIAIALMIGGITVLGVVTGTLASWIVGSVSDDEAEEHAATREQVAELQDEIRQLREQIAGTANSSAETVDRPRAAELPLTAGTGEVSQE